MINLPWFKWLAETVKEESNTGTEKEYKTYYETTFTDTGESIEKIFNGGDKEVLSNEAKFKARVKAIIYTPTIFIEDTDKDY